jgi:hypothetical protein
MLRARLGSPASGNNADWQINDAGDIEMAGFGVSHDPLFDHDA